MNCIHCSKSLRTDNKIGVCRKHRAISESRKQYMNMYAKNNVEKIKEIKKRHQPKATANFLKKRKTNLDFKLRTILRTRLTKALKNKNKVGSSVKDLGCTIEYLRKYLESKFEPGMSWENYGIKGWHIDHIIPLSSVDLTIRDNFLKVCHYTNLQPLWALDNIKKSNRI